MKCSDEIIDYMHEYLDEEISQDHEKILREHLQKCPDCQEYFHDLCKAIALVKSTANTQAPINFTANVVAKLPKEKKKIGIQRWLQSHPFLTAASVFFLLMVGSLFSNWNQSQEFSVSKQPNLLIENDTAIVPEGEVVKGDIIVRNGKIKIEGQVDGNVTIINGEQYLASAGHVTGEVKEINAVFEWIWYHLKETAKDVVHVFGEQQEQEQEQSFQ